MSDILLSAFLLSVILLGIHSFFGIEIIRRGIIFTDLAIGQMAALGAAVSLLFLHGEFLYPISLAFSLCGGLLIALVSRTSDKPEAFIGLLYAFGISAVFILLSRSPHGSEEFGRLMAADILFTPARKILETGILYLLTGVFLFFFYRKRTGLPRDIIFFVSFAITVTSSVQLAGVLVVFTLLVGPAMISLRTGKSILLVKAWITGAIINLLAIIISYSVDLPTGYTIACINSLCALAVTVLPLKKNLIKIQNQQEITK